MIFTLQVDMSDAYKGEATNAPCISADEVLSTISTTIVQFDNEEIPILISPNKGAFLKDEYLRNRHKLKYKTQYKR